MPRLFAFATNMPPRSPLRAASLALLLSAAIAGNAPPAAAQSTTNRTGIYYDANQPGWGINLVHQGTTLVATWYTYAADGKPMWVLGALNQQADGSFGGTLSRYTGISFAQINGQPASTGNTPLGTATASFDSAGKLSFNYTIGTTSQTRTAAPLALNTTPPSCGFTSASRAGATNYTDLWWNPAEPGWGVTLAHQGSMIFVAWYTYDGNGRDQWITSSVASKQADGSYQGTLSRPVSGTPYDQINGAATGFPLPSVGTVTLRFSNGESGTMAYTLDGVTQTKAISRFAFGSPAHVCTESGSPPTGAGKCNPPLLTGDNYLVRSVSGSEAPVDLKQVIGDSMSFDGKSYRVINIYDAQNKLSSRTYFSLDSQNFATYAQEGFDPATGNLIGTIRYNPPNVLALDWTVGQSRTLEYAATTTTAGGQFQSENTETTKLLGYEDLTVPAGRFADVCKFETTLVSKTLLSGFPLVTNTKLTRWINSVGLLKSVAVQTAPSNNLTTTTTEDLLSAQVNGVRYP